MRGERAKAPIWMAPPPVPGTFLGIPDTEDAAMLHSHSGQHVGQIAFIVGILIWLAGCSALEDAMRSARNKANEALGGAPRSGAGDTPKSSPQEEPPSGVAKHTGSSAPTAPQKQPPAPEPTSPPPQSSKPAPQRGAGTAASPKDPRFWYEPRHYFARADWYAENADLGELVKLVPPEGSKEVELFMGKDLEERLRTYPVGGTAGN